MNNWNLNPNISLTINILNNIDTFELQLKINKFRELTPRIASQDELLGRLKEAIPIHILFHQEINRPELYRIRKNANDQLFNNYSDFWEPPKSKATLGRLNKQNESILYLCLEPVTPFHEAKMKSGDSFTLIFYNYKTTKRILALLIEGISLNRENVLTENGLTKIGVINYNLMCDFIRTEFIKDVGIGTEYLYNTTNLIKNYFDKDDKEQAFLYSSISNYKYRNCAVKPKVAKELLKVGSCIYGRLLGYEDKGETVIIEPILHLNELDKDTKFEYEQYAKGPIVLKMVDRDNIKK